MSEEMSEEWKRVSLEKLLLKSKGAPYEMALRQIIEARLSSSQHQETSRQPPFDSIVDVKNETSESYRPSQRNNTEGSSLRHAVDYAPHPAAEVSDSAGGDDSSCYDINKLSKQQLNSAACPDTKKIKSLPCVSDNCDSNNQSWLRGVSSYSKNAEAEILHSQDKINSSMNVRPQKHQWTSNEYSSRKERNRKNETVEDFEPHDSLILCDNTSGHSSSSAWSDRFSRDKVVESGRKTRSSSEGRRVSDLTSHSKNKPSASPSSSSSKAMRGQSDSVRNSNRSVTPRSHHSTRSPSSSDCSSEYACRSGRDDTSQQEQSIRPFHPLLAAQKTNDRILAASGSQDDFNKRAAQSVQNYYIRQVLAHDRGERAPAVGQYTKSIVLPYDQRHSASMSSSDASRRSSVSDRKQHTFGKEQYKDSFMQHSLSQVCPLRTSEGNGVPGPGQYAKSLVVPYYQRHRSDSKSNGMSGTNGHTWGSERYDAFNTSRRSSTPDKSMHFMSDSSVSSGVSRSSSSYFNINSSSSRSERSRSAPRAGRAVTVTPRDKQLSQLLHMISNTGTQTQSQCPRPHVSRGRYT